MTSACQGSRGEAQQIDGVGAIEIGQRLGELPHQGEGQEDPQQQPEQSAEGGEDHKLQHEPAKHPARRHPEDDELGEQGRRTLCTKRWALNTKNNPTAMASRERAVRFRASASRAGWHRALG